MWFLRNTTTAQWLLLLRNNSVASTQYVAPTPHSLDCRIYATLVASTPQPPGGWWCCLETTEGVGGGGGTGPEPPPVTFTYPPQTIYFFLQTLYLPYHNV